VLDKYNAICENKIYKIQQEFGVKQVEMPFKIIESKIDRRTHFDTEDGRQPTHALFFLKQGQFTVEIDGTRQEIVAGDCVIWPDYVHFRRYVVDPIVFVYIKFAPNPKCPFSFELPHGKVTVQDQQRLRSSITQLESLLDRDEPLAAMMREHLLMDMLFQIHLEQHPVGTSSHGTSYHDPIVAAAATYITDHVHQKLTVKELCRVANTNPSTLNFKFRRETGRSIGQYITDARMKRARHLLLGSTYPLAEIAVRCGFDNGYYFSNAFKKHHGISPSAYRKQL